MDATLQRTTTHEPVGFGTAFTEQFRLLWMSRRPLLMLLGMLGVLALAGEPWGDGPFARLLTPVFIWLVLIGPFWAFVVWHNEGPGNRLYFWSQPVSRTGHSLARVAAGAAWLVILYALLVLAGALFALFDGDLAHFAVPGFAAWVSLFTTPLAGYLIASILTVPSDYPIRWFLAFLFGVPIIVTFMVKAFGLGPALERWATPLLIDETWGFLIAMFGPAAVAGERLGDFVAGEPTGGGGLREVVDYGSWWLNMLLWMLLFLAIVVLLARRHPDAFPRWRRYR